MTPMTKEQALMMAGSVECWRKWEGKSMNKKRIKEEEEVDKKIIKEKKQFKRCKEQNKTSRAP